MPEDLEDSEIDSHWIENAIRHKGALHRALGIPEDQKIPINRIREAAKSKNKHLARMGRLALKLESFRHDR